MVENGQIHYRLTSPLVFGAEHVNGYAHFDIVFIQNTDDYDDFENETGGVRNNPDAAFRYLLQWETGDEILQGTTVGTDMPWGGRDDLIIITTPSGDEYVISYNDDFRYVGMIRLAN